MTLIIALILVVISITVTHLYVVRKRRVVLFKSDINFTFVESEILRAIPGYHIEKNPLIGYRFDKLYRETDEIECLVYSISNNYCCFNIRISAEQLNSFTGAYDRAIVVRNVIKRGFGD